MQKDRSGWWQDSDGYDYLRRVERSMFAWEWLRRTEPYRQAWRDFASGQIRGGVAFAAEFGLVDFVSPWLSGAEARPIWHAAWDPRVISATPWPGSAPLKDLFDVRHLARFAAVSLDPDDVEHWRIGNAARSIRLDVRNGTLLGGPTPLRFELIGLARLKPQLAPIGHLVQLSAMAHPEFKAEGALRAERWMLELRTADALIGGAGQKEITRGLFGTAMARSQWRLDDDSLRSRTRRLVKAARMRLADPLSPMWFETRER